MNRPHWTVALLLAAALAAGCENETTHVAEADAPEIDGAAIEAELEEAGEEAADAGEETQRTFSEAAEDTGEQLDQSRKEFAADLEQRLEGIDERIALLKTRAEDLSAEGKAELQDSWTRLEARREVVARRLDEVRESTSENWQEVREKTSAAWNEFEEAVRKTADKLTD